MDSLFKVAKCLALQLVYRYPTTKNNITNYHNDDIHTTETNLVHVFSFSIAIKTTVSVSS